VCEVAVPLAEVLAGATGAGAQPWEPRDVLNVSYCLGPVEAPVIERAPEKSTYAPVGISQQPFDRQPSAVLYQATPASGRSAVRVPEHDKAGQQAAGGSPAVRVAEHDEAGQQSPIMGVPQKALHLPAKPDASRPPTPPPRPEAVHATGHENAPAPAPPPRNGGSNWASLPHNTRRLHVHRQPAAAAEPRRYCHWERVRLRPSHSQPRLVPGREVLERHGGCRVVFDTNKKNKL
jgi:hypothetical protein